MSITYPFIYMAIQNITIYGEPDPSSSGGSEPIPTIAKNALDRSVAESNKYKVSNLCYPENVSVDPDVQHYVMFYINVRESSKFNKNNRIGYTTLAGQNRTDQALNNVNLGVNTPVGRAGVDTTTARDLTYGAGVTGGGYLIGKAVAGKGVGLIAGGAAAIGSTKAGSGTGTENIFHVERTQRISDVITLAVQSAPSVSYGVDWQQSELGSLMGVLAGGSSAADTNNLASNMSSDIARRMMEVAATIPGSLNTNNRVQNTMESGTKRVANPFREVLFKSVGFRRFEYTYRFMPKSENESNLVNNIIKTFKFHMHPELVPSGLYYIYPSEFDIVYYFKGKENKWLNKVSTCALTDMRVDYGGQGNYSTFNTGAPTEINLTLTFTELETMTKQRIEEGY